MQCGGVSWWLLVLLVRFWSRSYSCGTCATVIFIVGSESPGGRQGPGWQGPLGGIVEELGGHLEPFS